MRLLSIACVCVLAWSASASAQQVEAAEQAFARGEQQFARGAYAEAEVEFRSAYDMMAGHPNQPMILVNLARSIEQQGGRESEALGLYEEMLAETETNPGAADARRIATERSTALRAQGVTTGGSMSPIGPIILGSGGAVAIAGAIVGALALAQRDSVLSECIDDRCPSSLADSAAQIDTLALVADVLLFGGIGIAAVGLILMFVLPGDDSMQAAASCGPYGCYAMLEGALP